MLFLVWIQIALRTQNIDEENIDKIQNYLPQNVCLILIPFKIHGFLLRCVQLSKELDFVITYLKTEKYLPISEIEEQTNIEIVLSGIDRVKIAWDVLNTANVYCQYSDIDSIIDHVRINIECTDNVIWVASVRFPEVLGDVILRFIKAYRILQMLWAVSHVGVSVHH